MADVSRIEELRKSLQKTDLPGETENEAAVDLCMDEIAAQTDSDLLDYVALVIARNMASRVAFKGGWMLNQIFNGKSRRTKDVDLSVSRTGDYDAIKIILARIAELLFRRGKIAYFKIKEDISPTSSGGITCYNADNEIVIGVDVGLHDISYGVKHYTTKVEVDAFTTERMLSDKLLSVLSRKRLRRIKDLYDIYALCYAFDFDGNKILECAVNRGMEPEWENIPFSSAALSEMEKAWDKLVIVSMGKERLAVEKPDFSDAVYVFNIFAERLKEAAVYGKTGSLVWNHNLGGWD